MKQSAEDWVAVEGSNSTPSKSPSPTVEDATIIKNFAWRGGTLRQTTGIWIWSEPFFRKTPSGEEVAVLLMDTQGIFDTVTPMKVTAQIFGLSTLVSSFQVNRQCI